MSSRYEVLSLALLSRHTACVCESVCEAECLAQLDTRNTFTCRSDISVKIATRPSKRRKTTGRERNPCALMSGCSASIYVTWQTTHSQSGCQEREREEESRSKIMCMQQINGRQKTRAGRWTGDERRQRDRSEWGFNICVGKCLCSQGISSSSAACRWADVHEVRRGEISLQMQKSPLS